MIKIKHLPFYNQLLSVLFHNGAQNIYWS